jgi:protein-tyrosine kinase
MARIREALRRADTIRGQPQEKALVPRPYRPEEGPFRTESDEEVPFIEVGGREVPMEASPSVLASLPKKHGGASSAEHRAEEQESAPAASPSPLAARGTAAAVEPTGIAFRPYPPEFSLAPARFAQDLVALHQPAHPISEEYRALVKKLEKQLPPGQSYVLLFTCPSPQTDPVPILLNLAITLARHDETPMIVVDANLRGATLAERLALPVGPGLAEVLAGRLSLPRAIQNIGQANLHVLTAGKTAHENTPLADDDAMRVVLRHLRSRFDWIFVNASCRDGRLEATGLGTACDAVYLVVPEADADTSAVEELSQLIVQRGGCLRGYLLVGSR